MVGQLLKRGAIAGAALIGAEAAYAVLRPAPFLPQFDPTSQLGSPDNPPLSVVVIGDSSVTAPGVAVPEEIWVSRIAARLAEHFSVQLRSFAIGGSMAHNLISDQAQPAIEAHPDLLFVSVGANDVIKGVSRTRFRANLTELVEMLAETGAVIVQSGVGDLGIIPRLRPPLRNMVSRRALAFDQIHRDVAEQYGTHVVEQRSDSLKPWYNDRDLWAPDLFHVSAKGHARWSETIWKTVEPLFPTLLEKAQTSLR